MKNGYLPVSAGLLALALCAGCAAGGDDVNDEGLMLAGTGAGPIAGAAGTTPQAGSTGTAGTTTMAGSTGTAGTTPMAGSTGAAGTMTAGAGGTTEPDDGGMPDPDTGTMPMGDGACCSDGDCLCHGEPPSAPTSSEGPFAFDSYDVSSAGCVFYPTDAEPPFAAVAISDGFLGSGGCSFSQTGDWGPLYASWGIVAMIIHTLGSDDPLTRSAKLSAGIEAFKAENQDSSSELFGKLAGRYGTSGFSMGGGGTTYSAENDPTLITNVSIMAWTPSTSGITVPSLYIFGSSDVVAGTMGYASYQSIEDSVPKMAVTVSSGHSGQPGAGGGASGEAGLAFQKVFLENDERWRPILLMVSADETTIQ